MLKDIFYEIYSFDGLNWFYLVLLTSFILFPVVLLFVTKWIRDYRKNHKKCTIFKIIILLLVSFPVFWELIPSGFNTLGLFNIKYYDIAINTSLFKTQKGLICLNKAMGLYINNDIKSALKTFEEAYGYFGGYNKAKGWLFGLITYTELGEIDKAIEIGKIVGDSSLLARCYMLKGDFKKALETINVDINNNEFFGSSAKYALRSYLNRMLGNEKEAQNDYKIALELCKNNRFGYSCKKNLRDIKGDYRSIELNKIKKKRLEYGLD